MLTSMNRSTQFVRHASSPLSSLPFLKAPVTHFLKHVSVKSCDSVREESISSRDQFARGLGQEERSHTGLDPGALLLVLDELAEILLVLVGEPVEIGLVDRGGVHGCFDGWCCCCGLVLLCMGSRRCREAWGWRK